MKIYLVGGAVRDEVMGIPVKDRDFVIVGATEEDVKHLLKMGFKPVGKDFPVFLNPKTKEEFALARTERKVGKGYAGFTFNTSPDVTLQQDLARRDLTINALAKETNNDLQNLQVIGKEPIDFFNGVEHIHQKILKHVSPAFAEDPVRILRLARFAARYPYFKVDPDTNELMRQMVKAGEVDALVAERVWKEWERALQEKNPERFFDVLEDCGALGILFPEFDILTIEKIKNMTWKSLESSFPVSVFRFGIFLSDLSEENAKKLCSRYRIPSEYRDFALIIIKNSGGLINVENADSILNLLTSTDAFRRENRFYAFLDACASLAEINDVMSNDKIVMTVNLLKKSLEATKSIHPSDFIKASDKGTEIADKIKKARLEAIQKVIMGNH